MNAINDWTENQKIIISEKKTKAMVFNFTENFHSSTRLQLKGCNIEFVDQMKILGTIINSRLSWNENCNAIISKVNARKQLIRGLQSFGSTKEEMVNF